MSKVKEPVGDVVAPVASWESVIANLLFPRSHRSTFSISFSNTLIIVFCQERICRTDHSLQMCPHDEQRRRFQGKKSGKFRKNKKIIANPLPRATGAVSLLPQCGHAPSLYVGWSFSPCARAPAMISLDWAASCSLTRSFTPPRALEYSQSIYIV